MEYSDHVAQQRDAFLKNAAAGRKEEDMCRIKKAYEFACEAHKNQKRKNGEPYILHPISVARIVNEEMGLGTNPIIASLLHDVVEDTPHTLNEIRREFGQDVAFLVHSLTKESKKRYTFSRQVDNIRKMLMTIEYDIRALIIKLADRLHNMRTLGDMPLNKQMKIASETDYFYAPLANRLGLYKVKTELENLSFKFRLPEEYNHLEKVVSAYKISTQEIVDRFVNQIDTYLREAHFEAKVTANIRSVYSLWKKMQVLQVPFNRLECIYVFNIVFKTQKIQGFNTEKNQCLYIYSILTNHFIEKVGSFHNYVDVPKANGYEGMHCKFMTEHGTWAEVHIRSERMEEAANRGCLVKRQEGAGITGVDAWVENFRGVLKDIAYKSSLLASENGFFLEDVKTSLYQDDIRVYTPKGEEILLPQNATALDLAYEIHTRIGDTAKYARINGKLSSIKTVLKRGDRVEIGTDPSVLPQKDWFDVVQTYKAKTGIRSALHKQKISTLPSKYCFASCCSPLPGDELIGFKKPDSKEKIMVHLRNCPEALRLSTEHGDYIANMDDFTPDAHALYPAQIYINGIDRQGITSELAQVISQVNITDFKIQTNESLFECTVNLQVHSSGELSALMERIQGLSGIEEIKRLW